MTTTTTPSAGTREDMPHPTYRPDIDGLRAIAVLSVVGYHAFPNRLPSGFIGVDVFFVISGYLISSIIIGGLGRNNFSLTEFYSRRIKRIFPALLLVLLTCYVLGWFALLSDEYKQLGKHIAGGAGFVSNLILWDESGYFDTSADNKLLLHLWSLGIEEQFYALWPILLWLGWTLRFNLRALTIIVGLASFALSVLSVNDDTVAAFYSPQTRIWELIAGALLAQVNQGARRTKPSPAAKFEETLSFSGALLLVAGFVLITNEKAFPGWWAVLPTAGSALIIHAGPRAWFNRTILSNQILVWIGLISFPLYLWHWPLLAFARIIQFGTPSAGQRLAIVVASIVLAWLTYHVVESPIRSGKNPRRKTAILMFCMLAMATAGAVSYALDGFAFRESVEARAYRDALDYQTHWIGWNKCGYVSDPAPNHGGCMTLDSERPINVLVIGDSHAGHLASGLRRLFASNSRNVAIMLHTGCFPFAPVTLNDKTYFQCHSDLIEKALAIAEQTPTIKLVVLSGYAQFQLGEGGRHETSRTGGQDDRAVAFASGLTRTLTRLTRADKKVVFVVDVPELLKDPKSCLARIPRIHFDEATCSLNLSRTDHLRRTSVFRAIISQAVKEFPDVTFTDTDAIFCDENECLASKDKSLLYASRDHLTPFGSNYLVSHISKDLLGDEQ